MDGCYESRDEGEMSGRDGRFLGKMMCGPYIAATGALRERARGLGKRRLGARMWARRGWAEKEGRGKGRKMFSILYVCVYTSKNVYPRPIQQRPGVSPLEGLKISVQDQDNDD